MSHVLFPPATISLAVALLGYLIWQYTARHFHLQYLGCRRIGLVLVVLACYARWPLIILRLFTSPQVPPSAKHPPGKTRQKDHPPELNFIQYGCPCWVGHRAASLVCGHNRLRSGYIRPHKGRRESKDYRISILLYLSREGVIKERTGRLRASGRRAWAYGTIPLRT